MKKPSYWEEYILSSAKKHPEIKNAYDRLFQVTYHNNVELQFGNYIAQMDPENAVARALKTAVENYKIKYQTYLQNAQMIDKIYQYTGCPLMVGQ